MLTALVACSDSEPETLHADSTFTLEERAEIQTGNEWMAERTGRRPYDIIWDAPHTPDGVVPPRGSVVRRDGAGAQFNGPQNVYYVGVAERAERRGLQALFAHEFGHRLGLQHVAVMGSVMDPKASAFVWSENEERQCIELRICDR